MYDYHEYLARIKQKSDTPKRAVIREAECIGCTKCLRACPVDTIVGAAKQMHSVIASECTGCELCIEPCPVDCIDMVAVEKPIYDLFNVQKRFAAREKRASASTKIDKNPAEINTIAERKAYIAAAAARVKAKRLFKILD